MFRRCVFLVRADAPPARIPSGLRNLNTVYLLSLVYTGYVAVFNKGNSSVKFDLCRRSLRFPRPLWKIAFRFVSPSTSVHVC